MAFSWPRVQPFSHCVTVGLSDRGHTDLFWNVLADEAVEVLVAAPFPRMVGCSKVAGKREVALELLVAVELSAVVESDCLEAGAVFSDSV